MKIAIPLALARINGTASAVQIIVVGLFAGCFMLTAYQFRWALTQGTSHQGRSVHNILAGLEPVPHEIDGEISGINFKNGKYVIEGWACQRSVNKSIRIHFYVDGPAGKGTGIGELSTMALLRSDKSVSERCNTSEIPHAFRVKIPTSVIRRYGGRRFWVHGIRAVGKVPNQPLNGSGTFAFPRYDGKIERIELSNDDKYYINGWACRPGWKKPLKLKVVAKDETDGGSTTIGTYKTAFFADEKIREACGMDRVPYRFRIRLWEKFLRRHGGKSLYIHVMGYNGDKERILLQDSGRFRFPLPLSKHPRGCIPPHYSEQGPMKTDGKATSNAYPSSFVPDNKSEYMYMAWVWREGTDSADARDNHSISVLRTRDMKVWTNSCGEEIKLPITRNSATVIDPVSMYSGVLNTRIQLSVGPDHNPIIAYQKHRYAEDPGTGLPQVTTQLYIARFKGKWGNGGFWQISEMTNWDTFDDYGGAGSLARSGNTLLFSPVGYHNGGNFYLPGDFYYQYVRRPSNDTSANLKTGFHTLTETGDGTSLKYDVHLKQRPPSEGGDPYFIKQYESRAPQMEQIDEHRFGANLWQKGAPLAAESGAWNAPGKAAHDDGHRRRDKRSPQLNHFIKYDHIARNRDRSWDCNGDRQTSRSDSWKECMHKFVTPLRYWFYDEQKKEWENSIIDSAVWGGANVRFGFTVFKDYRIVVYYDPVIVPDDPQQGYIQIVLAVHKDGEVDAATGKKSWRKRVLAGSTFDGWDLHNSLFLYVDDNENVHITGNMHGHPLNYWRTADLDFKDNAPALEKAAMVSLTPLKIGDIENRVTYPTFFRGMDGGLYFMFRSGVSGNGSRYIYKYNPDSQKWSMFVNLFHGGDL